MTAAAAMSQNPGYRGTNAIWVIELLLTLPCHWSSHFIQFVGTFKVIGESQVWFSAHGRQPCYCLSIPAALNSSWSKMMQIRYQQNYKSWGIKQLTDEKLHCCIFTANRWRTILAAAVPDFLVKAIAGSTNIIIAAAQKKASSNNTETKSPAAFISLLRLNTYVCTLYW